jgi:hypothetical protein
LAQRLGQVGVVFTTVASKRRGSWQRHRRASNEPRTRTLLCAREPRYIRARRVSPPSPQISEAPPAPAAGSPARLHSSHAAIWSENGVRSAQKMHNGPCITVRAQLEGARKDGVRLAQKNLMQVGPCIPVGKWGHSYERRKLAELMGRLGGLLTLWLGRWPRLWEPVG